MCFGAGAENPQGAENSAVKNTAPFSLTPLKISENASILSGGLSAKFAGIRAKESAPASRSSKSKRRSGMVVPAESRHNCSPDAGQCQLGDHPVNLKMMGTNTAPNGAAKNPNQALWEKGNFTEIAAFMRQSGEAVVESLGVTVPLRALDLGCGDGTTALPLARQGADVTGVDIARNLVEAGNKRAAEAGLNRLKFHQGDACNLVGVEDDSFELTLSVVGASFKQRPFDVANEMVRVTKPGGQIVMGNWIPNDPTFVSQLLRISSAFTPPPPEGSVSPMTWGVESHIIERFGRAGVPKENISMVTDTYYFAHFEKNPTEFIELFERFYGPTMNAVDAARSNGKEEELHTQLVELANSQNKSNAGTFIPATFMRVTVNV